MLTPNPTRKDAAVALKNVMYILRIHGNSFEIQDQVDLFAMPEVDGMQSLMFYFDTEIKRLLVSKELSHAYLKDILHAAYCGCESCWSRVRHGQAYLEELLSR